MPAGLVCFTYTDPSFANGGNFRLTSNNVNGAIYAPGGACTGKLIGDTVTIRYGVESVAGDMTFRILNLTSGTLNIQVNDWTTYPTCP